LGNSREEHLRVIEREMLEWMEEHEYESVEQLKDSPAQFSSKICKAKGK